MSAEEYLFLYYTEPLPYEVIVLGAVPARLNMAQEGFEALWADASAQYEAMVGKSFGALPKLHSTDELLEAVEKQMRNDKRSRATHVSEAISLSVI